VENLLHDSKDKRVTDGSCVVDRHHKLYQFYWTPKEDDCDEEYVEQSKMMDVLPSMPLCRKSFKSAKNLFDEGSIDSIKCVKTTMMSIPMHNIPCMKVLNKNLLG
jgi:hypothetical protein